MSLSKMICNWFVPRSAIRKDIPYEDFIKTNPHAMHSHLVREKIDQEKAVVRDFVVKIAAKMAEGFFEYNFGNYFNDFPFLSYKEIKIHCNSSIYYIAISICSTYIEINDEEKKILQTEWDKLEGKRIKQWEENKIIKQNEAIKSMEDFFNE